MITVAELIGLCESTHAHHNCLSGSSSSPPPRFEAVTSHLGAFKLTPETALEINK
jgi:hypothetical protein